MANPVLDATRAKRDATQTAIDTLLAAPTAEARALTDDEAGEFEKLAAEIKKLDGQFAALSADEARIEAGHAAEAELEQKRKLLPVGDGVVRSEPTTYSKFGSRSYFLDLATLEVNARRMGGTKYTADECLARLHQNDKEVRIDTPKHADNEARGFYAGLEQMGGTAEQRVNPNTTAGTGGEFVPPLWLVSQYIPLVRPGRVCANRVPNHPLPPGIDVINIPKITTGTLTAIQTANAAAVASQDMVTTSVSASVRTIAGQEDISLQLMEQSPLNMDGVIFDDLSRDYDLQLDKQILNGSAASGQHQGIFTLTGATSNTDATKVNFVTCASTVFHDASTAATQYRSLINGVNQIEVLRVAPATAIWAHPRRVNSWRFTAVDSTYRPMFNAYSSFNALGMDNPNVPQGVAGELAGLPVVKDANIPTTAVTGASTGGTGDIIAVLKEDDLILWEGTMRSRALPEILSGTLQIRFQVYAYSAFMPNRYAAAISVLTGTTGLAAASF